MAISVLTLLVGGAFITQNLIQRPQGTMPNSPFLTAIPSSIHPGQQLLLRLTHFSRSTNVYLTHDLQEMVQTDVGAALVTVDPTGSRVVHVLIDSSWGAGVHTLEAEDVTTHYTTTTTIQVLGTESIKPTSLLVSQSHLDMGVDLQGANTIQPLELHNAGDGTISWTASSNQPWLQFTPTHGVFSNGEHISVAVTRVGLKPGANYRGIITINARVASQNLLPGIYNAILTFASLNGGNETLQHVVASLIISSHVSSSGTPVSQPSSTSSVGVGSTVTATSYPSSPVLAQLPSDVSFSSTQGQSAPANQNVAITNTGGSALQWQASIPTSASSWLSASSLTGTVAAGQTGQMTLSVQSTQLEVGSYTTQVTVSATNSARVQVQNSPQLLNVTLTVYAPCVLQVTPSTLSFTAALLTPKPAGQNITLSETGNCARPISWQAVADHSWLTLSKSSGTDDSTITVHINASGMLLGTYNARITLSATDQNGANTQHSPQTISVTLTVIG